MREFIEGVVAPVGLVAFAAYTIYRFALFTGGAA